MYAIAIVTATTLAQALNIVMTIARVLDGSCVGNYVQPPNPYIRGIDVAFLLINFITDVLLVSQGCSYVCYITETNEKGTNV